jgi:hypothetical protein
MYAIIARTITSKATNPTLIPTMVPVDKVTPEVLVGLDVGVGTLVAAIDDAGDEASKNVWADVALSLSRAARRSAVGHCPCAHGFDLQHPRKGGDVAAQLHQLLWL